MQSDELLADVRGEPDGFAVGEALEGHRRGRVIGDRRREILVALERLHAVATAVDEHQAAVGFRHRTVEATGGRITAQPAEVAEPAGAKVTGHANVRLWPIQLMDR